jgi:hypothetical protein
VYSHGIDYHCSWLFEGKCYDCLYDFQICHRAVPSHIYTNAKIYTVDEEDADWNNL